MSNTKVFRHVVGKSTLKEGITVHKDFTDWFSSPEVGCKRTITLVYENDKEVEVVLRRLNNKGRHVQVKYETANSRRFRDWLEGVFKASRDQTVGEILEFHKVSKDEYSLKPLTLEMVDGTNLLISNGSSRIDFQCSTFDSPGNRS